MTYQEFLSYMAQYEQDAYQSIYTGVQIDDAVGKSLAALPVDNTLSTTGKAADAKKTGDELNALKSAINNPVTGLKTKAPVIIDTASGAIASFDDGADDLPIKSLTVNIEPVQAGSGDPSPQNVRPISGWTGCNISHSGADTSDPTVISISWQSEAGTVYGGTLDVTSGVLTVTHAKRTLTASGITFSDRISAQNRVWFTQNDKAIYNQADDPLTMCETAIVSPVKNTAFNPDWFCIGIGSGNQETYIGGVTYLPGVTNLSTFKTWLNNNPITYTYKLKTPQVYQLTPTEISTLLGTNNIWADCGHVSVDYPADTKLYIQKINAPTDDDMTADTQIDSGKYFLIGNTLYKSTTVIPAGDTIIPGTNCTKTNLAEALNALNS